MKLRPLLTDDCSFHLIINSLIVYLRLFIHKIFNSFITLIFNHLSYLLNWIFMVLYITSFQLKEILIPLQLIRQPIRLFHLFQKSNNEFIIRLPIETQTFNILENPYKLRRSFRKKLFRGSFAFSNTYHRLTFFISRLNPWKTSIQ